MCCTPLTENTGRKKSPKIAIWAISHNFVRLYLRNWGTYRQSEKNWLNSNMSFRCSHNMVKFSPLAAEIFLSVWGIPKFQLVLRLGSITERHVVVGVCLFMALNRGHHLCSAGRPSHWALAHISSYYYFNTMISWCVAVGSGSGNLFIFYFQFIWHLFWNAHYLFTLHRL